MKGYYRDKSAKSCYYKKFVEGEAWDFIEKQKPGNFWVVIKTFQGAFKRTYLMDIYIINGNRPEEYSETLSNGDYKSYTIYAHCKNYAEALKDIRDFEKEIKEKKC